ncbi:MAG: transglycosylase SLT domain-containing protein, partial [Nitrososphaerota archaeon]|nr:transglycosylase SLT domain-containing protein [Nitrososphaerota archaeon]
EWQHEENSRIAFARNAVDLLKRFLGAGSGGSGGYRRWDPKGGVAQWGDLINKYAQQYGVSALLIAAVMDIESGGNPGSSNDWDSNAQAGTPSMGLMQFIWPTMQGYAQQGHIDLKGKSGADALTDPELSIQVAAYAFSVELPKYGGDEAAMIAACWSPITAGKLLAKEADLGGSFDSSGVRQDPAGHGLNNQYDGQKFAEAAMKFVGQAYQWGAGHEGTGVGPVDCSGLADRAWALAFNEPNPSRDVQGWHALCKDVSPTASNPEPPAGYVLIYGDDSHMAISIGGGQAVEAPGSPAAWNNPSYVDTAHPVRIFAIKDRPDFAYTGLPNGVTPGTVATGAAGGADNPYVAAFNVDYFLPKVLDPSMIFLGDHALIADEPLIDTVRTLCKSSLRSYMETPDGRFLAFFPDYFGIVKQSPFFTIRDIEVQDLNIEWADAGMATHVFAAGDVLQGFADTPFDQLTAWMDSAGIVSVEQQGVMDALIAHDPDDPAYKLLKDAGTILKRFGARPVKEGPLRYLGSHILEYFYALHQFMMYWSKMWQTTGKFSFLPEVFPGGRVGFEGHDLICFVERVKHVWDNESGYQTFLTLTTPQSAGGRQNAGMPLAQDLSPAGP